ncbi:hypothetical protein DICPUDRAFT_82439 [Dictyostelium purpureum]|uniref:Uncharacterized protein n=1 Tax=Dictyostelium purpureum TaxID=5786 RepID=F0ZWI5_DICPU|nr:uncharacterized protein DICPUDRAFT_82439 [Dictyostelium purpureum]EGC31690.1 hypothetical protein DICPUDRAFT_82439 [Dictyostelium purpureum]|eukprot:XP_003291788.1 hypothetical protein DICPUDRAFT_82439 [Dictyostelium purpureum]
MTDNNTITEIPVFIDGTKLLNFKVKDLNKNLEELRSSLGTIIPFDHVFEDKDGAIDAEDEEHKKISDALVDNAIHFKTQISIAKDQGVELSQDFQTLAINIKGVSNSTSVKSTSTTEPKTDDKPKDDTQNESNAEKEERATKNAGLTNINIEENRSDIYEYCKNLPLRYSIDSETFEDRAEVVQWDISNALIFPPQETLTFITKSTFNSVEHNAHKGGLYSWNGTLALKSIVNATHKGSVEKDETKAKESKTVYSYTHGMVSRLEIRIEQEHITLKSSFISDLEDASSDLNSLKNFLKTREFFPTRFVLGGKISSTGYKKDCTESDKETFGLTLENHFKTSFHDSVNLELGANVNKNNSNSNTSIDNCSFDEKKVFGGTSSLRDDFDKYILSLEKIGSCSIIEIGNLCTIWKILKNQNKELHEKCMNLLDSEEKTLNVKVYSSVKTSLTKGYSKFIINGKEIDFGSNVGFNVVLLDSKGSNLDSKFFYTSSVFFFINRSKNLARYLNSVKDGTIVLISVNGDGFSRLSELAQKALTDIGIDGVEFKEAQSSFCAILRKGDKSELVQSSRDNSEAFVEKTFIIKK